MIEDDSPDGYYSISLGLRLEAHPFGSILPLGISENIISFCLADRKEMPSRGGVVEAVNIRS